MSLHSIRSERAFCRELDYNLLYRWFLDMDLMEPSFDAQDFVEVVGDSVQLGEYVEADGGRGSAGLLVSFRAHGESACF